MNPPRQPLLGAALAASAGILLAEFLPAPIGPLCCAIILVALVTLIRPTAWLTLPLITAAFFALHLEQMTDAPGKALSARLGNRSRVVTVTGTVASEPKVSPNDYNTFLLHLGTIELDGQRAACAATVRVRWKENPQFGDALKLRGIMEPIPPQRNPGILDFRSYLARRDVYQSLFARYPSDGTILQTGGGNFVERAAARARAWMQTTLARGLEDSPDVVGADQRHGAWNPARNA